MRCPKCGTEVGVTVSDLLTAMQTGKDVWLYETQNSGVFACKGLPRMDGRVVEKAINSGLIELVCQIGRKQNVIGCASDTKPT